MIKIFTRNKILMANLLCVVLISAFSLQAYASQNAAPYMTAKRYNLSGQLTGIISPEPDGSGTPYHPAVRYTYNNNGLLESTETGYLYPWEDENIAPKNWAGFNESVTQKFTYNSDGWKLTALTTSGNNTKLSLIQYSYDGYGRVQCKTVRMNKNAYGSLPSSACTLGAEGTNGPDRITRYTYDALDQVLKEERAVGTIIQQTYATSVYSSYGLRSDVTDANGNRTHMNYDGYGRLEKLSFPDKNTTGGGGYSTTDIEEYTYDANGNLITLTKRDKSIITYDVDNLNQVWRKRYSTADKPVYYQYDLRGLKKQATFSSYSGVGVLHKYDGHGRLKRETNNTTGSTYNVNHQYDDNSNRKRITYPDGKYVQYSYDGLDRLTTLQQNNTTGGAMITHVYDEHARLKNINRANNAHSTIAYTDTSPQVSLINHNLYRSSHDISYTYEFNQASQLTSLKLSNSFYHHSSNTVGEKGDYEVNGLNQYTKVNGKILKNDKNGNLTSDGNNTYTYDIENRLLTSTNNNTVIKYDPLGRLSTVKSAGTTTKFLFDGNALIAQYVGSRMTNRFVHGGGIDNPLVAYKTSSIATRNRVFLHTNHQGSIVAASRNYGVKDYINTYDSFGVPETTNKGVFGYTGQLWIAGLELNYYKARIYHPKLGRFLQTDPVGYEDQMNLYAYVGNDPVNMIDPAGKTSEPVWTKFDSTFEGFKNFVSFSQGSQKLLRNTGATVIPSAALTRNSNAQVVATIAGLGTGPYALLIAGTAGVVDLYQSGSLSTLTGVSAGQFVNKAGENAKGKAKYLVWALGVATGSTASSSMAESESEHSQIQSSSNISSEGTSSSGSNSEPYKNGMGGKVCTASGAGMNRCQ